MPKPSATKPVFSSKQTTIEHVRDQVLDALRPALADSALRISVRDSPKTNSKYIYLYYPERADNPDQERVPYTIRISDHDQTYLFRRNRPNAYVRIVPVLDEQQRQQREQRIRLYEHLSTSLQLGQQAQPKPSAEELRRLRDQVAGQLQKEQETFRYTYEITGIPGDRATDRLDAIIHQMRTIALAGIPVTGIPHLQYG